MISRKKRTISAMECHSLTVMKRVTRNEFINKIHKKHKISYKTLFYMKEYGPNSHVATVIIKESLKILLLASLISSIGGANIKSVEDRLIAILPLLVLLPSLNDMIGDFGTIVSTKFTTMLFLGKVGERWWSSPDVQKLILTVFLTALITSFYIGSLSYFVAFLKGYTFSYTMYFKVVMVALISSAVLVGLTIIVSVAGGFYIFKKKEDPNNFMIPLTTSVSDLGSLLMLTMLIGLFF